MCGITGIFGNNWNEDELRAMIASQRHRGPDAEGFYAAPGHVAGFGHNRLSIIDLSDAAAQPMFDASGRYRITFNGEIYNYLELRRELEGEYSFKTHSDTEVLLAAFIKWGDACLDKLIGMFAFAIWDERDRVGFAARDRFGVKPFYYSTRPDGTLLFSSEIKALHAAGVAREPNVAMWSGYLALGLYDHSNETFWQGVKSLPAGHKLSWCNRAHSISRWYDLASVVGDETDTRDEAVVREEYLELMKDSVRLRFRSDVQVGINLSGGLDSSSLLGLVQEVQGHDNDVKAFTFVTGDDRYDELPWVRQMLERTKHELIACELSAAEVPELAASVQYFQDEPFSGLPTLAYARVFEEARRRNVIVLLDGNGMDEQWCGYDYYQKALAGETAGTVQGTVDSPVRPDCLSAEFRELAAKPLMPKPFRDEIRNLQYRDAFVTKIPRAMRFNDRVSMRSSTELREPFLDHRLFELAFRQSTERKIANGTRKKMLRETVSKIVPKNLTEAPKRPLQTPQREWLRGELREWAVSMIETGLNDFGGGWLDGAKVKTQFEEFCEGRSDNSFYIWQWISLGLMSSRAAQTASRT